MSINLLRSILILIVIQIHISPFTQAYPDLQHAVLGFIIPLFLFLTGYLFNAKKSYRQYASYLLKFTVPYIVLETAYLCLSAYLPVRDGIGELTAGNVAYHLLIAPLGPYWYLHTMLICGTIYFLSEKTFSKWKRGGTLAVALSCAMAVAYLTPLIGVPAMLAFFAGVVARKWEWTIDGMFHSSPWAALPFFITVVYGVSGDVAFASQMSIYAVVAGASFSSFLLWAERRIPHRMLHVLAFIGANTLPIYLFHPIFTMLAKKCLGVLLDIDGSVTLFSLITLLIAVGGSLAITVVLDRTGLSWLFGQRRLLR